MKKIADTGLLVAAADPHDRDHAWAAAALREHSPFFTCEAVVLETAWVLGSPRGVLGLLARGDLQLDPDFDFATELPPLLALCTKYADREMDLAWRINRRSRERIRRPSGSPCQTNEGSIDGK